MKPMRGLSKSFYLGSYLAGLLLGFGALLTALALYLAGWAGAALGCLIAGVALWVYAKAVAIVFIWAMWRVIQEARPSLTPLKALLPLFVPVFSFYWIFRVIRGFAFDFNAFAAERAYPQASISTRLPTVFCVMTLIPPLWLATPVVFAAFMNVVCDAVNAISRGRVSLAREGLPRTLIDVQHLGKNYGSLRALHDVSFSVERGEVVGFLGPNAAGKTTAMRILSGFMPATTGTAKIAGRDVFSESLEARRCIGYMPEGVAFYPEMRVIEYLKYRARLKGVPSWARPAAVAQSMARCAVADVAWRLIGDLSKGYRQRVGLADALLSDPPILILDEPTVGLDPNQIIQVRGMIKELGQDHTILLSTHILPEVEAVCRRVLIIHKGRLIFSGAPEESDTDGVVISLEVRGPADRVQTALSAIEGVLRVRVENGLFTVVQTPGADAREAIFLAMARNEWPIVEMRRKRNSLEDVFVRLTAEER